MNFSNTTQTYTRPISKFGVRRRVRTLPEFSMSTGVVTLLQDTAKIVFFVVAMVLLLNFWFSSSITKIENSMLTLNNVKHELIDENIEKLAQRAHLTNPANLQRLAENKLSLFSTNDRQVGVYDRRRGDFRPGKFNRKTRSFTYL